MHCPETPGISDLHTPFYVCLVSAMNNTAAKHRAARRDYWNRPDVVKTWHRVDYGFMVLAAGLIVTIGSLNWN